MGLLVYSNIAAINSKLTYNKSEKLKSRKAIDLLFAKGIGISAFPIKVLYNYSEDQKANLQAGVTASSRHFKKAVDRNRIKRVLREAYRLQKLPLQNQLLEQNKRMVLFFIYIGKELPNFEDVYKKMGSVLHQLINNLSNQPKA